MDAIAFGLTLGTACAGSFAAAHALTLLTGRAWIGFVGGLCAALLIWCAALLAIQPHAHSESGRYAPQTAIGVR